MPKFPAIPRLSIVVPACGDAARLEESLLSVLEKMPCGCEVIVVHDGGYDDPFDLSDEVQFVIAESNNVIKQVEAALQLVRGRFVHVLASGFHATSGWVDHALEKFEHHDVGAIAPVVRDSQRNTIIAAGWSDQATQLCCPNSTGRPELNRFETANVGGVHLETSFWLRECLRGAIQCYSGTDTIEFSYAVGKSLSQAGFRSVVADQCDIQLNSGEIQWTDNSFSRGQRLQAIRCVFEPNRSSFGDGLRSLIASTIRPSSISAAIGQMLAGFAGGEMAQKVRPGEIAHFGERQRVLKMQIEQQTPRRRVA